MAEDKMDADRAARLFGENVLNALMDAVEKRLIARSSGIDVEMRAEIMRLDEVIRLQSERIDVNVYHSTDRNSDLVRRVVRLERDLEAFEIVAFKGSPQIGPSLKSMIGSMTTSIDALSKSVEKLEAKTDDPDRFISAFQRVASNEMRDASGADRAFEDMAQWTAHAQDSFVVGIDEFVPIAKRSGDQEFMTDKLEACKREIDRLHAIRSKHVDELRTERKIVRNLHKQLDGKEARIDELSAQRDAHAAEIRRLVEANSAAQVDRAPIAFTMPPVDVPPEFERGYNAGLKRGLAEIEDLRGQMSIIDHDRAGLSMDLTEIKAWRVTAEAIIQKAIELRAVPMSGQFAARSNLNEAVEAHEKACSERANDVAF
jgi:chromosome segregation ATPase